MAEELVVLTRGQEALYRYVLFSEAKVTDKMQVLERMGDLFKADKPFLRMIRETAEQTGEVVGYDFLVKSDFPYHLEPVLDGENFLSTAEAYATLGNEFRLAEKRRSSSELMAISRHLLECLDPEECAKGKCPVLPKQDPRILLDQITVRLAGGLKKTRELDFNEIYQARKNRSLGPMTFVRPFDEKIRGLEPGTLAVIAGWTGSYKTTMGLNLAYGNAVTNGYNAVIVTSEVPKEILYLYLLCRHSYNERFADHGPVHRMETQKAILSAEDEKFLREVVEPDLKNNPEYGKILILDETDFESFTKAGIRAKLLSLKWDVDLLIYDYIQLVKYLDEGREIDRYGKVDPVNVYVRIFADLAMHLYGERHKLVSVLLSQINREGWKKAVENDGEYDLTALAEANELEKSASYVIALYSDEDLKEAGELKMQLLKHRGGETLCSSILVPLDSRYLAIGHGVEGFGEAESSDMSGMLAKGTADDLFGGG